MDIATLLLNSKFTPDFKQGTNLKDIQGSNLNLKFSHEFPDGTLFYYHGKYGFINLSFDNLGNLFETKLNLNENHINYSFRGKELKIVAFQDIIDFLNENNLEWSFDRKRTYYRIITVIVNKRLRVVYNFEKDGLNNRLSYLYEIDETHKYNML